MITLQNISKQFISGGKAITALQHINLQVNQGEILGIIGKSGAGKSTLIRCINLLETPTSGNIIVNQEALLTLSKTALRKARRQIGMIFQQFNLLASRTAYQNIAFPLELIGMSSSEIRRTVMPLLELTGLLEKENVYPAELSGGQKQRVAIARALAYKPAILLSDEATSALDPETTTTILDLLKKIRDTLNVTILLITHEMSVIKTICDRVGILHHGRLIEENEVGDFFADPKTAIAKNFIVASLMHHLPPAIAAHLMKNEHPKTHAVLRFSFFGDAATQPIIAQLVTEFQLKINILQANVEYIKQKAMGMMILAIAGEKTKLLAGIAYAEKLGVQVELVGYVPDDIISFT